MPEWLDTEISPELREKGLKNREKRKIELQRRQMEEARQGGSDGDSNRDDDDSDDDN